MTSNPKCILKGKRAMSYSTFFKDEVEQIMKGAEKTLPVSEFDFFEKEFIELLIDPSVKDWYIKLLKLFEPILDYDDLTRRLLRAFRIHWLYRNQDFNFLEMAYLNLDGRTFRRFYAEMLEFAAAAEYDQRLVIGNRLLEIVRERELTHRIEYQIMEAAFPFRFYEKFRYLFLFYLMLTPSRYEQLLELINDHERRGSPNNEYEIQRFGYIALDFFGSNELLKEGLLNFCMGDTVKPDSVAPIGLNHPLANFQTWNSPTPLNPTSMDAQGIQIPNHPAANSLISNNHKYPALDISDSGTPVNVMAGQNPALLELSSQCSPKPDSATSVEHDIRRVPMRPVPVRHNYPVQNGSSSDNLFEKRCSDLTTGIAFATGHETPLGPRSLVGDPRTKSLVGSNFSAFDYCKPLVRADTDLNDETTMRSAKTERESQISRE